MRAGEESKSALVVSLMRAVHSLNDFDPLIDDPYGMALVGREERAGLCSALAARLGIAPQSLGGPEGDAALGAVLAAYPGYGNVIIRTRYAEDRLDEALKSGVAQYVIVGAGLDTFCLRRPELSEILQVFEIDHPATQAQKLQRLAGAGLKLPGNCSYLPADFERRTIKDALMESGFDPEQPALFSWLGVSPYLTGAANKSALESIADCAARESALVFNYVSATGSGTTSDPSRARPQQSGEDEPILSRLEPEAVQGFLRHTGFEVLEDLGPREVMDRYCRGRKDRLRPTNNFRIVYAQRRG